MFFFLTLLEHPTSVNTCRFRKSRCKRIDKNHFIRHLMSRATHFYGTFSIIMSAIRTTIKSKYLTSARIQILWNVSNIIVASIWIDASDFDIIKRMIWTVLYFVLMCQLKLSACLSLVFLHQIWNRKIMSCKLKTKQTLRR